MCREYIQPLVRWPATVDGVVGWMIWVAGWMDGWMSARVPDTHTPVPSTIIFPLTTLFAVSLPPHTHTHTAEV